MTTETKARLEVVRVEVENVLGIKSAALDVGSVTRIFGENGEGKTSLHRAIEAAFRGAGAEVIRLGADQGRVLLRLRSPEGADVTVDRKIGRGAGVKVTRAVDGVPLAIPKPQTYLDGVLGDLSFDPGAFATEKPATQVSMFTRAFPCTLAGEAGEAAKMYGVDVTRHGLEALSALASALTERRRALGRDIDDRAAVLEADRPANLDAEEDPIAEETAAGDLEAANATLAQSLERAHAIESHERSKRLLERQIAEKREQMRRLAVEIDGHERELARVGPAPEPIDMATAAADVTTARATLDAVRRENAAARKCAEWKKKFAALGQANEMYARLGEIIAKTRGEWLHDLFAQVHVPIAGLALGESDGSPCLTVDGVPLKTLNTARQIRVGMQIAAALNAGYAVRVVAIDDAEHLTRESRAILEAEAEAAGFQVLLFIAASVCDVPPGALVMRDGRVDTL